MERDVPSVLREIEARKFEEVAGRKARQPLGELESRIRDLPPTRGFTEQLRSCFQAEPAIIAEIKRASPSAGIIREDFDPVWLAERYQSGGAACLSVLTDGPGFQGNAQYLRLAHEAVDLPILRKDFTVDAWQIAESRVMGADAILLIAAILSTSQLQDYSARARASGLDVLLEVHNEQELEQALTTDVELIGINNRDLHRFETELATSERLVRQIPSDRLVVAESGIHTAADLNRLGQAGIRCFLIGEGLMRQPDPGEALQALLQR